MEDLLEKITDNSVECDESLNGYCTLPGSCDSYQSLQDYAFKFEFANVTNSNYMRVPLFTFAQANSASGGCDLFLTALNSTAPNVVLGGMFFQEFFGVFKNNYTVEYIAQQAS